MDDELSSLRTAHMELVTEQGALAGEAKVRFSPLCYPLDLQIMLINPHRRKNVVWPIERKSFGL
jgi:hypothetical protein